MKSSPFANFRTNKKLQILKKKKLKTWTQTADSLPTTGTHAFSFRTFPSRCVPSSLQRLRLFSLESSRLCPLFKCTILRLYLKSLETPRCHRLICRWALSWDACSLSSALMPDSDKSHCCAPRQLNLAFREDVTQVLLIIPDQTWSLQLSDQIELECMFVY